tara:strand:+ start:2329 stop:2706 length:378 start_codon:yes stop_codon:yes gene_type:complete
MKAEISKVITEDFLSKFIDISGDDNPMHTDDIFAKKSFFKKRVIHGFIPAMFFSTLFGTKLPGPGSIYLNQNIKFHKPIYIDDKIKLQVEIIDINLLKKTITLKNICIVDNSIALDGEANIFYPF